MDFKDFGPDSPADKRGLPDRRWWTLEEEQMPGAIAATVRAIKESQTNLETQRQISGRLYGSLSLLGVNGMGVNRLASNQPIVRDRISFNVISSVIDTLAAKIAKTRPKPLFLTSGGDYRLQRQAKKLNQFCEGVFYENRTSELGPSVFRDSAIWGDGVVHVFPKDGRIAYERVISSELYVDELDGFYGEPRQMHRVKLVDRRVLGELWGKHLDKIMECSAMPMETVGGRVGMVADLIPVVESWHLPSGPKAKDGIHTISIETCVLMRETWKRTSFPFAVLPWCRRLTGFWSQGLAEQLQNIQVEVNKILWTIQRSMHLMGTWKVWLHPAAKIVSEHINNDIGSIIRSESEPKYLVPPIVAPEVYAHLQTLKNSAYEQAGISQLSANSQKPAGLNSGKALREYNDIEGDRFQVASRSYEQFHLDLARLSIETAREMAKAGESVKVKSPGRKFLDSIDWADVDLPEESYTLQCYPVSSLPNDPAGRLQTVQEFVQAGFYDQATAKRLLDFPDLAQVDTLDGAVEDRVVMVLDAIVEDGEYTPPDAYMDPQLSMRLALQTYNHGACSGLEEKKLELLRTFMEQLGDLTNKSAPPPQAQPTAVPQAPQQSDLIPNVPQSAA